MFGVSPYIGWSGGVSGAPTKRQRLDMTRVDLTNAFKQHEPHLRDLADYIRPRRPRWYTSDRNKGDRRNQKIIDSSAVFASNVLRAGMHSGMTSPARPWMKVGTGDQELNDFAPVKEYLFKLTQRMMTIFSFTNIYNALPVLYGDMGDFATGAMGIMQDGKDLFRCYNYPIGSYSFATDSRGLPSHWVYECEKTVIEVVEEYLFDADSKTIDWSRGSKELKNAWDRGHFQHKINVAWVIIPNMELDPSSLKSAERLPFYSAHYECGSERDNVFLRESGYNEFPIMIPRWSVTGNDWWGTDCPGMTALGDNKQLQIGEKRGLQALEKMVFPPLKAPTQMRHQKTSLLPSDITYFDPMTGGEGPTALHEVNLRLDHLSAKQAEVRSRVSRAYFEDLFMMLARSDPTRGIQPPTATEVAERHEEKLIALGPTLERSNDELLDPAFERVYAMMDRNGLLPEPPPELEGRELMPEYTSILAQAQKLVNVVSMERFFTSTRAMVEMFPSARFKIDENKAIDNMGDMLGVDPGIIRPTEEAQEMAAQEAQAAAAQQQGQVAKDMGSAAQSLSNADLETDNALRRIVQGI